jgi:hypothetical protein
VRVLFYAEIAVTADASAMKRTPPFDRFFHSLGNKRSCAGRVFNGGVEYSQIQSMSIPCSG